MVKTSEKLEQIRLEYGNISLVKTMRLLKLTGD